MGTGLVIRIKRVYEKRSEGDGFRILVDRLWPRGVSKERAAADLWLREVGPSDGLRRWFSHEPERWEEFQERYREELKGKGALLDAIREAEAEHGTVALLYSARDAARNQAVVLRALLAKG